jgi:hypothetical protein
VVFWEVRVVWDIVTDVLEQPVVYTLRLEGEDELSYTFEILVHICQST